ncbi:MAG: SRPBCC family protein [Actinomycetota bacterium]
MSTRKVSRSVTVAAQPEEIFELLAHPSGHAALDGSGTVKGGVAPDDERLSLGARFGMKMRMGLPYRITNEVVEFEEGRRIAWRHAGGHIWRWQLEPVEGGTRVTETFDWGAAKAPPALERAGIPARNTRAIEQTLSNVAARFGPTED